MSNHRFLARMPLVGWPIMMVLILLLSPQGAKAQESKASQKSQDEDEVVRVKSNLVNIDVMVKDKKGKYISDLQAEDFTIFENGVKQKVEFFDAPLVGTDKTGKPGGTLQVESSASGSAPRNYVSLTACFFVVAAIVAVKGSSDLRDLLRDTKAGTDERRSNRL